MVLKQDREAADGRTRFYREHLRATLISRWPRAPTAIDGKRSSSSSSSSSNSFPFSLLSSIARLMPPLLPRSGKERAGEDMRAATWGQQLDGGDAWNGPTMTVKIGPRRTSVSSMRVPVTL